MRRLPPLVTLALAGTLTATTVLSGVLAGPAVSAPTAPTAATAAPSLHVTRLVTGLDIPWDVKAIGTQKYLITERTVRRLRLWDHGTLHTVAFPSGQVWASGETGLMGLAVDPGFSSNRRFFTCSGGFRGGSSHDVRIDSWRLTTAENQAQHQRTLLRGLPATSGRHGGCRLLITTYGALMVGTGDAATGRNPRSLASLGGKTLRLNRSTGSPWPSNPFIHSRTRNARYITSYGHRNVQGLAQRNDGSIWSVEQGTDRDDEVNEIHAGGDYGYNPVPGDNENVPMTDPKLPGTQYAAKWRSGYPTLATSGGTFVSGTQWGSYNGSLAVAALKSERVMFMKFSSTGRLISVSTPSALRQYGRMRSITRLGNGDLLMTTSNGGGNDSVLLVRATS